MKRTTRVARRKVLRLSSENRFACSYFHYPAAGSSKLYIVRSCLDAKLIRAATTQDNELQEAEMDDLVDRGLATDKDEIPDRPLGTLLAWKNMEPMALTGVLQLVLCLILVNGRSLPERESAV